MSDTSEVLESTQQKSETATGDTQKENVEYEQDYQSQALQTQYFAARKSCSPESEAFADDKMEMSNVPQPLNLSIDLSNISSR